MLEYRLAGRARISEQVDYLGELMKVTKKDTGDLGRGLLAQLKAKMSKGGFEKLEQLLHEAKEARYGKGKNKLGKEMEANGEVASEEHPEG